MTAVSTAEFDGRELRRICWLPDATCLRGGCVWCHASPPRRLEVIWSWAQTAGPVRDRTGEATTDAREALEYGLTHDTGPGRRLPSFEG